MQDGSIKKGKKHAYVRAVFNEENMIVNEAEVVSKHAVNKTLEKGE